MLQSGINASNNATNDAVSQTYRPMLSQIRRILSANEVPPQIQQLFLFLYMRIEVKCCTIADGFRQ